MIRPFMPPSRHAAMAMHHRDVEDEEQVHRLKHTVYGIASVMLGAGAAAATLAVMRYAMLVYWTARGSNAISWTSAIAAAFYACVYSSKRIPAVLTSLALPLAMMGVFLWFRADPHFAYVFASFFLGYVAWCDGRWIAGLASLLVCCRSCDVSSLD